MLMTPDQADTIALKALKWLVGSEEALPVFLGASGASKDDMAKQAGDPNFLTSVMDFLLMDDAWVVAFCDAEGVAYDVPMRARQSLNGAEMVNWT